MAVANKTVGTELLALQEVTAGTVVVSSELSIAPVIACWLTIHFGRVVATALTGPVRFRLDGRVRGTGPGYWFPLFEAWSGTTACEAEALSGAEIAGATVLEVASTANLTVHDLIFIKNTTIANSDWQRIRAITTNTSVTLEDPDGLRNAQSSASTLYNFAERFSELIDLSAVETVRFVCNGASSGVNFAVEVVINTLDSFE